MHVCARYNERYDSLRKVAIKNKKKKGLKSAVTNTSLGTDSYLVSVGECIQHSPLLSGSHPLVTFEGRYFNLKTVKSGLLLIVIY